MLPISDILIRSISGYVFIVPVIILYFLYLKKSGRKQSFLHITSVFVFCYYLFGILTVRGSEKISGTERMAKGTEKTDRSLEN